MGRGTERTGNSPPLRLHRPRPHGGARLTGRAGCPRLGRSPGLRPPGLVVGRPSAPLGREGPLPLASPPDTESGSPHPLPDRGAEADLGGEPWGCGGPARRSCTSSPESECPAGCPPVGGYTLQPDTVTCTSCLLRHPRWPLAARQDTAQKPLTWTPGSRGLEGKASTVPWIICVGPQQTHLAMTSALHGLQPPRPGSLDVPRPTRAALDGRCVGGAGAGPWTWCGHAAPLLGHRCSRAWQWLAVANGAHRWARASGRPRGRPVAGSRASPARAFGWPGGWCPPGPAVCAASVGERKGSRRPGGMWG